MQQYLQFFANILQTNGVRYTYSSDEKSYLICRILQHISKSLKLGGSNFSTSSPNIVKAYCSRNYSEIIKIMKNGKYIWSAFASFINESMDQLPQFLYIQRAHEIVRRVLMCTGLYARLYLLYCGLSFSKALLLNTSNFYGIHAIFIVVKHSRFSLYCRRGGCKNRKFVKLPSTHLEGKQK